MGAFRGTALADAVGFARFRALSAPRTGFREALADAFELEWEHRRFFLWVPVLAGVGVLLFLGADHEPSMGASGTTTAVLCGLRSGCGASARPSCWWSPGLP